MPKYERKGKNWVYLTNYNKDQVKELKERVLRKFQKLSKTFPNLRLNWVFFEKIDRKDLKIYTSLILAEETFKYLEIYKKSGLNKLSPWQIAILARYIKGSEKIGNSLILKILD